MTLNLLTDGAFLLRMEYLERKTVLVDVGRWAIEGGKLTLLGSGERPEYFRVLSPETIRKLDGEGREIKTGLNHDLRREAAFRLIQDPAALSGMFVYMADAATITLCRTGQTLTVGMEADYLSLEKEYAAKRSAPGAPLLAAFTGHLEERKKTEGAGTRLVLVVDRFEKVQPGESCPPLKEFGTRSPSRIPAGENWNLVTLKGRPVPAGSGKVEAPSLRFDAGSHRLAGYTGCNRLHGRFVLKGDSMTISNLVTTRKACKDGGELETVLLTALGDVTGWSISGDRLTLYARKEIVAEFVEKEE
jgi:copper homeostasis protein (lipoprotein)